MSLPAAPKDISSHPAPGSVVDPVNKANKDADVDRKLRLYGVIEAFRQGRMPSNAQIDETLQYVIDHLEGEPAKEEKLSGEGRKLVKDVREIVETAKVIVKVKNADELFQNFVWHTRYIDTSPVKKEKEPSETSTSTTSTSSQPTESKTKKDKDPDAQQAVQHLRTILTLILTNSEVRKLLSDFSLIGRDLLARGAAMASESVRPDPERLVGVDDAGPQDQFVSKDGRTVGTHETPVFEMGAEKVEKEKAGAGVNGAEEKSSGDVSEREGEHVNGVGSGHGSGEKKRGGLLGKMKEMKEGLSENVNDQFKRGRQFLTDDYFPEERREQFIYRGKKVIIECQKHDDYQDSLRWLLSYLNDYAAQGKKIATEQSKDGQKTLKSDPALKQAMRELRTLLERFANGKSVADIVDAGNALVDDAKRDEEFRVWWGKVNSYVRKVLLQPGYVLEAGCTKEGNALRDSGRHFYDDKYKGHFDYLFSTVGDWFKAMGEDALNQRFGEDWARLTRDLLFDSEGGLKFKPDLWKDLRGVILPTLGDKVGYIPIPRIEYTDDSLDLVVENLTLSGRNLFPNIVTIEAQNMIKFSPYSAISDEAHHEFTFTFGQMQADMRDIAFYIRKKTGIRWKDAGLADVVLGGNGLTATVHLVSADKDKSSVFKVKHVHVKVDGLKFSLRDTKHDLIYKTVKPLAKRLIKKQIQRAIANAVTTGMEYVDGLLVTVRDRMREAKESESETSSQVLHDLFKKQQGKEDGHSTTGSHDRHSQFKVVANKRQSIVVDKGSPVGWVNKTAEKEKEAVEGVDWRSEAFHVVHV